MIRRITVDSEQIQALRDGQEIVVLVRMEPQPEWTTMEIAPVDLVHRGACPVAVGDTVEVIPTDTLGISNDGGTAFCQHSGFQPVLRPTVLHIAYREQDGVHNWEVRLSK